MAEKVILHVGPNKTGTTALQEAFVANSATLARHHIAYPMTGRVFHAHHGLARACRKGDAALLGDLADEIRWEGTVLLSSEGFSSLLPEALQRLREALDDVSVEVIYFLRRLPDLWPSHWKEMVKHGQHLSFTDYMARPAETDRSAFSAPPMPSYQLHVLAQVFGRESLRIPIYEARPSADGDFGIEFARKFLSVGDQADAFVTPRCNRTPPDWQIEVLRLINFRTQDRLHAAGKRRLARAALNRLNTDPPEWTGAFKALFGQSDAVALSSQTPAVASETAAVLRDFRDRLIEPPEPYAQHTDSRVRTFDFTQLGADLNAELDAFVDDLLKRNLSSLG